MMNTNDLKVFSNTFSDLHKLIEDVREKRTTDISYVRKIGSRVANTACNLAEDKFTINCAVAMLDEFHKMLDDLDSWD